MAKKVILRFKHFISPEEMAYYAKKIKEDLEKYKVIFVNSGVEVFIVEDGDEIRIENEEANASLEKSINRIIDNIRDIRS